MTKSLAVRRLGAIAVTFLVVATIAVWVVGRGNSAAPVSSGSGGRPTPEEIAARTSGWTSGEVVEPELARSFEAKMSEHDLLDGLVREDRAEISARASEMIALYRQGTVQEFAEWLKANTFPVGPWEGDPDGLAAKRWARFQAALDRGPLDIEGAQVLLRSKDGRVVQKAGIKGRTQSMFRDASAVAANGSNDIDIESHTGPLVEVIVPMQFRDDSGDPFIVDGGLIFGRRTDGRWIPVGTAQYGLPMGIGVPGPPF